MALEGFNPKIQEAFDCARSMEAWRTAKGMNVVERSDAIAIIQHLREYLNQADHFDEVFGEFRCDDFTVDTMLRAVVEEYLDV